MAVNNPPFGLGRMPAGSSRCMPAIFEAEHRPRFPRLIFAIDPGTTESAWVLYAPGDELKPLRGFGKEANATVLDRCSGAGIYGLVDFVIEMVEGRGMPVGKETFETVFWIGRFYETLLRHGRGVNRIFRSTIKLRICGSARAKDSNIRRALIDRFGGQEAIGTKRSPGVLYGVSKDVWAALAVAVTYNDNLLGFT